MSVAAAVAVAVAVAVLHIGNPGECRLVPLASAPPTITRTRCSHESRHCGQLGSSVYCFSSLLLLSSSSSLTLYCFIFL